VFARWRSFAVGKHCNKGKCINIIKNVKLSCYRHSGDKGKRRYKSHSSLTSAQAGLSSQRHSPAGFNSGERTSLASRQKAGWASEPVWTQRLGIKLALPLPGIESRLPGHSVCTQTLYWLSYTSSLLWLISVLLVSRLFWIDLLCACSQHQSELLHFTVHCHVKASPSVRCVSAALVTVGTLTSSTNAVFRLPISVRF
jgi:hypothetical protein